MEGGGLQLDDNVIHGEDELIWIEQALEIGDAQVLHIRRVLQRSGEE